MAEMASRILPLQLKAALVLLGQSSFHGNKRAHQPPEITNKCNLQKERTGSKRTGGNRGGLEKEANTWQLGCGAEPERPQAAGPRKRRALQGGYSSWQRERRPLQVRERHKESRWSMGQ